MLAPLLGDAQPDEGGGGEKTGMRCDRVERSARATPPVPTSASGACSVEAAWSKSCQKQGRSGVLPVEDDAKVLKTCVCNTSGNFWSINDDLMDSYSSIN